VSDQAAKRDAIFKTETTIALEFTLGNYCIWLTCVRVELDVISARNLIRTEAISMTPSKTSCEPKDVLCRAIKEFDAWANAELKKEQVAGEIVLPLYHYTDLGGLKGILEHRQIWFTHYQYLNDPSELIFGVALAYEAVQKIIKENDEAERLTQFFNVLLTMFKDPNFHKNLAFYTASFCRKGDDLGQWRAYANNGRGFAIGLSPKLFKIDENISIEDTNHNDHSNCIPVTATENVQSKLPEFVGHVCYGNDCNRIYFLLQKAAEKFLEVDKCLRGLRCFPEDDEKFMNDFSRCILARSLIYYNLTSKHDEYAIEKEVRLLILNTTGHIRDKIKTRVRGSLLVPYIPQPISIDHSDMIHEIIIGPAADNKMEKSLEFLLNEFGYRQEIKIRRSEIPFRVV